MGKQGFDEAPEGKQNVFQQGHPTRRIKASKKEKENRKDKIERGKHGFL